MKIKKINNLDEFLKTIDRCHDIVELVSPEGDRLNLKSKLAQYVSLTAIIANGYITELELIAENPNDYELLEAYLNAQQ